MSKNEYYEKLKDPRWQKKRLEIFERDHWKCRACGSAGKTLHVHHIFYLPKTEPWDVPNGLLITLCADCHNAKPCRDVDDCSKCPDFSDNGGDCDGFDNTPQSLIDCIASILDETWKSDGDYFVILGHLFFYLKEKNNK